MAMNLDTNIVLLQPYIILQILRMMKFVVIFQKDMKIVNYEKLKLKLS